MNEIIEKLAAAAETGWEAYLRQAQINATTWAVFGVAGVAIAVAVGWYLFKQKSRGDFDFEFAIGLWGIFGAMPALIVATVAVHQCLTGFCNPRVLGAPKIAAVKFEEFWKQVQNKVGKAAARRAFEKAIRKTDPETILGTLRAHERERARMPDPPNPIHPATFMNGERWEDEPLAEAYRRELARKAKRARAKKADTGPAHAPPEFLEWVRENYPAAKRWSPRQILDRWQDLKAEFVKSTR